MLLRLSEITCRFAERTVLRGVNLTVNEGEVLLLGGGNGAGKSTLLRIMAGLLRPQAGRVDRDGRGSRAARGRSEDEGHRRSRRVVVMVSAGGKTQSCLPWCG